MNTHAIRVHETGGPEVLRWESIELPPPGPGEARVRHSAIGVNFIDTYHRSGLYPIPLPAVLGSEGAGVVEEVGEGVSSVAVGDRVAYGTGPRGAYAEARNVPARELVRLPASIEDRAAAASMLKGLTAHYLMEYARERLDSTRVAVIHAAAGGVGSFLSPWLASLGITVIGTVGSEAKAALARANGCAHVINYRHEDVAARVRELTEGKGADVVYDGVGKDTFEASLDALRPRGLIVSFGQASGPVAPMAPLVLSAKGSLTLARPKLSDFVLTEAELARRAKELFDAIASGVLQVHAAQTYPLRSAAVAHADLEARKTTGSTLLLP